jgi:hypothetical protein
MDSVTISIEPDCILPLNFPILTWKIVFDGLLKMAEAGQIRYKPSAG